MHDVLVIGSGAAGLMCALVAGQRGRRVLLVEHANRVGKKILMSGGGRCNFTNTGATPANYLSANPHFCKSALARCDNLTVIDIAADTVAALAALTDRGMRLQCMIQDGQAELYGEGGSITVQQALRMAPTARA